MNDKIRIGITHGDLNGVGYELILKTFADEAMSEMCVPIVYGSPKAAIFHRKALGLETNFQTVSDAADAVEGRLNMIPCFDEEVKIDLGHPTAESGRAALLSLQRAVKDYKEGLIDAIVTAPVNKKAIHSDEFPFCGHTEFFESETGKAGDALMILMNPVMRVALVTTHLPLKDVAGTITQEKVEHCIGQLQRSLYRDFLVSVPRIAVLGLNPHNGDEGLLGSEETEIIQPAVKAMREKGVQCFGPYAADGFFGSGQYRHFDAVLAMYHDQGLAPFKALCGNDGVNFTAGLDLVRTSPDHGTACDIAGKGVADENSFRQAIYAAIDIVRCRRQVDEASANPLKVKTREDGGSRRKEKEVE